ncbi:hypothetical protein MY11210_004392 [Beauveria gryllotalpidicola]
MYNTLSLIYATDEAGSLDPDVLSDKTVDKDRGGYCLEFNVFFLQGIRSKAGADGHEQAAGNYPMRFGDEDAGWKEMYAFADAE